ncbi:DMT family transporter, partial [Candidatus Uhrbacteria bacterium]|nr:DMT family transporter [Candidatus Uhrbacteria bacterium]
VRGWPTASVYPAIIGFGALFVFALLGFFEALKRAEASRVVPIVGSLIPIFTLAGTSLFFQERFGSAQLAGFVLLMIATWLLTSSGVRKKYVSRSTLLIAVLSAFLFAASSVCGKYAFDHASFLSVFILSRVIAGVVGIALGLFLTGSRQELFSMLHPAERKTKQKYVSWAIAGQTCGGIGFILVSASIALGSAAIVNALQAVQYAAIILVAWFGGRHLRTVLHEEVSKSIIISKSIAILFVAIGLALLA